MARRPVSLEDARALGEASAALQARVAGLAGELPLSTPPPPAEVQRALGSDDLSCLPVPQPGGAPLHVVYLETLVNQGKVWNEVVHPLLRGAVRPETFPEAKEIPNMHGLLHHLLLGYAVILPATGSPRAVDVEGLQQRSVGEPTTESQVIGPKESFVEKFETNLGLIRNRLRDPALRVEYFVVGRRSRTRVALCYLRDVARPELVSRVRAGLRSIAVDFIRTAMDVAELTFQHGWTVFPLEEQTERPDRVAEGLSKGRVVLVVEGTPFTLLVPVTFFDFQHDGEGALPGPAVSAFIRVLRFSGLFLAVGLPGLYVAVLTANPLIMPTPLSITVAAARFAIPYPVATETVLMLLVADVLAEATAQASQALGNALSIVGTLIVGQLMVQAHLASTLLMIVVSASVMGAFLTLKFPLSYALRVWKYFGVALAAVAGLLGWFTAFLVLVVHLANLESAGIPYLAPLAAARRPAAAARIVVEPGKGRLPLRPAHYRPVDAVSARRRGRR